VSALLLLLYCEIGAGEIWDLGGRSIGREGSLSLSIGFATPIDELTGLGKSLLFRVRALFGGQVYYRNVCVSFPPKGGGGFFLVKSYSRCELRFVVATSKASSSAGD
jgi:hypothetical protein